MSNWSKIRQALDMLLVYSNQMSTSSSETMTSHMLVEKMIGHIPNDVMCDPEATFCDPACGKGTFLLCLVVRLFEALEDVIPDERERMRNIVSRVYGYDVNSSQVRVTKKLLSKLVSHFGVEEQDINVVCVDSLNLASDMKRFDVIVGNPPFQPAVENGNGAGSANKIWHRFIELAFKLTKDDGHILFVTPNNWRAGNFTKSVVKEAQRLMWEEATILWYKDVKNHFPTVSKGASITFDAWHVRKGRHETTVPQSELRSAMVLPRDEAALSIFVKFFNTCVRSATHIPFHGTNDGRTFQMGKTAPCEKCVYRHAITNSKTKDGIFHWYDRKTFAFDKRKVIVSDSGLLYPWYDDGTCGLSSSSYGYEVPSLEAGQALISFLSSPLVKFIVNEMSSRPDPVRFPLQLFRRLPKSLLTTPWQQVFGFTDDELALIEGAIVEPKPKSQPKPKKSKKGKLAA